MAGFDYTEAHAVAVELITFFGEAGTLIKKGNDSGVDGYGNVTAATQDVTITGLVTPLLEYERFEVDETNVLSTDSYVFFDSTTEPEIDMIITINSDEYRVINFEALTSVDDINVYRQLQLRR